MKRFLKQLKRALTFALLALAIPAALGAQSMSSTNYKIPFDDLSGGGVRSTSTGYLLEDTVSEQATPSGEGLSSTNYKACAGFQCLQQEEFLTVTIATDTSPCTATTTGGTFTVALGTLSRFRPARPISASSPPLTISAGRWRRSATPGPD